MATRTKLVAKRSSKYLEDALYKRLFREGSSLESVRRELDDFLKSRKRVFKWEVGVTIRKLRDRKRFRPALKATVQLPSALNMKGLVQLLSYRPRLQVLDHARWHILCQTNTAAGKGQLSETMARRGMNLTVSDQAIRLDLVAKARGVASAEEYFINLPEPAKHHLTYGALLNCYCKELMPDKAEALMEKMKELKFASSPMAYNSLMTLYTKTNQPEKVPSIIQEMKTNDVLPDCYTYNVWMRALAAINDISSVERVIEEMKRDGRVTADWTTYSNLASIFVDAGMFQKAEEALKELEKRNMDNDLRAYQFLITLYGRTGNLVEVHRIWRFLKLAHPKMANISYLNMIQVLVNLKDLPGAEACFKDWESKCSTYDIRVANAMIRAYAKEGMLDKAEAVKKRAKMRGARLNAKTWEIFMEYYLNKGDMKMAHWCADRAIKKGRSHGRIWVPPREVIRAIMAYFEENKDVAGAENFIELLQKVVNDLEAEVFEALVRTYAAAGKNSPGMRRRLKMENAVVSEATEKLLDIVCVE